MRKPLKDTYPADVIWIYAQRTNDGEWIGRFLTVAGCKRKSIEDSRLFDETPIGEMKQSEFAIFKNHPEASWKDFPPRYYLDMRDKSKRRIGGILSGLINSFESDWF